ncbi:MAG: hypothetical protein GX321_09040 [Clostridiales bacterium]|nr:hypothetical protein [Clostridiales bacterium]
MSSKTNFQGNKQKYKNSNSRNKYSKRSLTTQETNIWLLLPIIFVMSVLPFIVRLKEYQTHLSGFSWFTYSDTYSDFFLYYKQVYFIITIFIMATIIIYRAYTEKRNIVYSPIIIPLAVYALLAFLSSIFSKYRSFSFRGIHEQFESVFALIGYFIVVYYCLQIIKSEKDLRLIINCFVVSILAMSLLGLTQYIGKDFYATDLGLKSILPIEHWSSRQDVKFNFEAGRVYLSFYNPNYVGTYSAMAVSFLIILAALTRKRKWMIPIYLVATVGISISLIGSRSKTGLIALIVAGIFSLIILGKYLIKYFYFSIPALLLLLSVVVLYNKAHDNQLINGIKQATVFTKSEPNLKDIITADDEVVIKYKAEELHLQYLIEDGYGTFFVKDHKGQEINLAYTEDNHEFLIQDDRFPNFRLGVAHFEELPLFYITIDNHNWFFTNQTDGSYYYLNQYGKLDKIETAPQGLFEGYERYASGRGYIWSRTIPLLKDRIILGSGADTYMIVFPQQDYVNLYNYGYGDQLMTKPHNLYLQIGVESGVLSLIAFLVFYGMYFISSVRLYIKCRFKSYYAQVGVAILVSTVAYMVLGIANDSSITVAPVFWAMIGLGIVVNRLAKPYIEEEILADKAKKEASNE